MALIEVPVRQLHQGVSRQPDHVRFPGQLQDAENLIFRVEEAGFSKRYGSQAINKFSTTPAPGVFCPFHVVDLASDEKYGVTIIAGNVYVMNLLTGALPTVTQAANTVSYLNQADPGALTFQTILDYTLIANAAVPVAMTGDTSAAGTFAAVFHVYDGRAGDYKVTVNATTATVTTNPADASTWDTTAIATSLVTQLSAGLGASFTVTQKGGVYILVKKNDNTSFTYSVSDPAGGLGIIQAVTNDYISTTDKLPPYAYDGMVVFIGAPGSQQNYYVKFVESPASTNRGYWQETIKPGIAYKLDPATLPVEMIRNGDGTFTVQRATWDDKTVGDTESVPAPDFVGKTINDLVFFKDRLGFLSGEWCWFSRTSAYFNFWPKHSTLSLDNDPFGLRGSVGRPAIQRFAVPYRKLMWTTADTNQFELSTASLFSPKQAVMDPSTSYVASQYCRPTTMAQMLYLTSWNGGNAIVLEYSYDYVTLTAVATEITKHVRGYVPHPLAWMTADQPSGNLFVGSAVDRDKIHVWTVYWDGMKREQSAWGTWSFGAGTIYGAKVAAGNLYILVGRGTELWIESIPLAEGVTNFPLYSPRLDRMVQLTGTYDAGANTTTYALPYNPTGVVGVLTNGNTVPSMTITGNNVIVPGNPGRIAFGFTYPSFAVLSKQYHRDQQGTAILNGNLSLSEFTVAHKDTGYYQVEIAQEGKTTMAYPFTARLLGDHSDLTGQQPIVSGEFQRPAGADAKRSIITIRNTSHLPHTISEIVFRGIFNETVRQG